MRLAAVVFVLCSSVSAAQGGPPAGPPLKGAAIPTLAPSAVTAIAPKVRSLRAVPATITLHVGQTMELTGITVVVVDSMGRDRGQLNGYDFSIKPGEAAEAVPRKITGKRPGETDLIIHYPKMSWTRKDPRAEVRVHVIVKP